MKIINDNDVNLDILKSKKIAILGYGNQGRAQSLNLRDSHLDVVVGLRENSATIKRVKGDGLKAVSIKEAVENADIISILIPDHTIPDVWKKYILPFLTKNQTILFSHGYNVHYKQIEIPTDVNVVMVAPSGGGNLVRDEFKNGSGVPNLLAVHQDYTGTSENIIKSYSKAIGGTRICAFYSTFSEETETDLFGEQAILTGGIPWLLNKSFKVLLKKGYSPIVSWFVCYYELKTIIDLFHSKGFNYLFDSISNTAKYGGLTKGKFLMDEEFDKKLEKILSDIKTGHFVDELSSINDFNKDQDSFDEIQSYTEKIFKLLNKK